MPGLIAKNFWFLMHRVELKVSLDAFTNFSSSFVPNAPCGVERGIEMVVLVVLLVFLMHRVELKGFFL